MPAFNRHSQNFNFAADDLLDPCLTFSRPSSATRINKTTGLIELVGPDVPRLERDGLLIEGAATNLLLNSENMSLHWSAFGGTPPVAVNDGFLATSSSVLFGVLAARTTQNYSASPYVFSVYAKRGNWRYVSLSIAGTSTYYSTFDFDTGTIAQGADGNILAAVDMGNGWFRLSTVSTPPAGGSVLDIALPDNDGNTMPAGAGRTVYLRNPQLETGTIATSYIPTTGAAASRAAEICTTKLSQPFWNSKNWTILFEGDGMLENASNAFEISDRSADLAGIIAIWRTNPDAIVLYNNATTIQPNYPSKKIKLAMSQGKNWTASLAGAAPIVSAAQPNKSEPILYLGHHGGMGGHFNGHIRRLQILPHDVSDLVLTAMSAQ